MIQHCHLHPYGCWRSDFARGRHGAGKGCMWRAVSVSSVCRLCPVTPLCPLHPFYTHTVHQSQKGVSGVARLSVATLPSAFCFLCLNQRRLRMLGEFHQFHGRLLMITASTLQYGAWAGSTTGRRKKTVPVVSG